MIDLRTNLIERRMVELDPELAAHYLTFNTHTTQRAIREGHVGELANKMERGLFRFGEVAFANKNGAHPLMINGQHVCHAVIRAKVTVPCMLEKFKVENDKELSDVFRQFEILPRSIRDMIRVEAAALGIIWPVHISFLIVAAAAMGVAGQKMLGYSPPSTKGIKNWLGKDERVKLLGSHLKAGAFVSDILTYNGSKPGCKASRHLQRAAVVYVMMNTWRKHQSDAGIFWQRVRDGENLRKTMPEMKIREFLLMTRMAVKGSAFASRAVKAHEYAYRCTLAWNSFRTNKPTNLAYHAGNKLPQLK